MPRGEYLVEQLQAGLRFVERVLAHPVDECGERLISIRARARSEGIELLSPTEPHATGRQRLLLARPRVVDQLLAAASALEASGHRLRIEDAFRTMEMQRDLALTDSILPKLAAAIRAAEPDASLETMSACLSVVVQAFPKGAGHMAGAAIDVTVVDPEGQELDRGGPYLTISEAMPMDSPFISPKAIANRRFINGIMEDNGFCPYPFEFWHYSIDDAFARIATNDPSPALYGPVGLQPNGGVAPVSEPLKPLYDPEELAAHLKRTTGVEPATSSLGSLRSTN